MSHLGDRLSALVDGELGGAERDKAYAHLARCEQCRAEAAALRELKRQLRSLAVEQPEVAVAEADVMRRLMAMSGIGGSQPRRRLRVPKPGLSRTALSRTGLPAPARGLRPPGTQPAGGRRPQIGRFSQRHRRSLVVGAVTVMVSLGTAAFTAGGGDTGSGPKVTPQMELYSEEHAITTGEVPFTGTPGTPGNPGNRGQVEGGMVPVGPASPASPASPVSPVSPTRTGSRSATAPARDITSTALDSGRPAQKP
ncbi:MAG TPA: zf-HC2 domain-containing protein [Streptosporangiaceae bacterium]